MRYNFLLITLLLLLINVSGCVSDKEQNAVAQVAAMINAGNSKIGYAQKISTDEENYKAIKIEFSDFSGIDESMTSEKLASIAASLYIQQLLHDDYKSFDKIEVTLKRGQTEFVKLYDIQELLEAEYLIKSVNTFFKAVEKNSVERVKATVDQKHISDSALIEIVNVLQQNDSIYGDISNITFTGFSFNTIKDTGDSIMVAGVEGLNGEYLTAFTFYVKRDNQKIVYIAINEE